MNSQINFGYPFLISYAHLLLALVLAMLLLLAWKLAGQENSIAHLLCSDFCSDVMAADILRLFILTCSRLLRM